MINNQCPLCSKANCLETVDFAIDGVVYRGIKCNACNSMLYSWNLKAEKEHQEFMDKYNKLVNY